jgi:hypothetical protein
LVDPPATENLPRPYRRRPLHRRAEALRRAQSGAGGSFGDSPHSRGPVPQGVHGQGRDREMEEGMAGPRPYESDWRPT